LEKFLKGWLFEELGLEKKGSAGFLRSLSFPGWKKPLLLCGTGVAGGILLGFVTPQVVRAHIFVYNEALLGVVNQLALYGFYRARDFKSMLNILWFPTIPQKGGFSAPNGFG